ncbi:Mitogen-activated protein kinase kinase kinase 7 [Halotydeus destructor]|nr:Mitogen-activated protein kinase kinase kinase 7 [Halotydeus destructor]
MEYAEEGSLYDELHTWVLPCSQARAISWALQCAEGLNYLHGQKPKPIVHGNLKSRNLLLFNGGTLVKICDFGMAQYKRSLWEIRNRERVAPEVLESGQYTEKCDVYSWATIVREIMGGSNVPFIIPAFWPSGSQHIESLMIKCLRKGHLLRPSMDAVETEMKLFADLMQGNPASEFLSAIIVKRRTLLGMICPLSDSQDTVPFPTCDEQCYGKTRTIGPPNPCIQDVNVSPNTDKWTDYATFLGDKSHQFANFEKATKFIRSLFPLLLPFKPDYFEVGYPNRSIRLVDHFRDLLKVLKVTPRGFEYFKRSVGLEPWEIAEQAHLKQQEVDANSDWLLIAYMFTRSSRNDEHCSKYQVFRNTRVEGQLLVLQKLDPLHSIIVMLNAPPRLPDKTNLPVEPEYESPLPSETNKRKACILL